MSKRIVEISPSVLGADLMRLGEEIKMAESLAARDTASAMT